MKTIENKMKVIGTVSTEKGFCVKLEKEFVKGLTGIEGFTHVQVLWYASKAPEWQDAGLVMPAPYKGAPERMGVFATRSPYRPNGLCISNAQVISIDKKKGIIEFAWLDAEEGTPVLDLKPYHPCEDRIISADVPSWCSTWPKCYEESGSFNWEDIFLF